MSPSNAARAEELDWKQGALGHLAPAIGTYRHAEVLADPGIRSALAALLPDEAIAALTENLGVVGPIDFIDGHLVLAGNRPHRGGEDSAQLWVKIFDGSLHVVLQRAGAYTLYSRAERFSYLPLGLRAALLAPPEAMPRDLPPGIAWDR